MGDKEGPRGEIIRERLLQAGNHLPRRDETFDVLSRMPVLFAERSAKLMQTVLTRLDKVSDARDSAAHESVKILVADDNGDAAESLAMLLRLGGYDAHVAADGASAFVLAEHLHPQAAVLDIGMPVMDGHELTRQLRTTAWGRQMLIIAVTGRGRQEDQIRALDAGFDRHFTKPVDPNALIACIAAWQEKGFPCP